MKDNRKIYIIAEAGVNHNGSVDIARKMVDVAKKCGADAVKFQTFKADRLVTKSALKADYQKQSTVTSDTQYEMLKKLELTENDFELIMNYCVKQGIEFLSSPFDEESADFLDVIGMKTFKIPSGEITNHPFLHHIAGKMKPVILSTGMSTLGEIEDALAIFYSYSVPSITLLHCVTEYPAPYNEINLRAISTLQTAFGLDVGYSDHTSGIEIPVAAVAFGASVIEKHFTLDTAMEGPDHRASLNPDDFLSMVKAIHNTAVALGDGLKKPAPCELKNMLIARKSVVAADTIYKGDALTADNLVIKRPGHGVQPKDFYRLIGMRVNRVVVKDEVLQWKDLA